jgi:hypothetical protein
MKTTTRKFRVPFNVCVIGKKFHWREFTNFHAAQLATIEPGAGEDLQQYINGKWTSIVDQNGCGDPK